MIVSVRVPYFAENCSAVIAPTKKLLRRRNKKKRNPSKGIAPAQ